ncbi:hypothetical protein BJ978_000158 [Agromyces terreus]|uniref:Uncharacterized protein n=1 Tax=Agromyces terreus TaxID=424795 RepID=A0A9X2H259_9MICO|nr:hypothetical protein [Agromyces terreus]
MHHRNRRVRTAAPTTRERSGAPPGIAEMGARDHRRDQWKVHTRGLRRLRRGTMGCTHFIAGSTIAERARECTPGVSYVVTRGRVVRRRARVSGVAARGRVGRPRARAGRASPRARESRCRVRVPELRDSRARTGFHRHVTWRACRASPRARACRASPRAGGSGVPARASGVAARAGIPLSRTSPGVAGFPRSNGIPPSCEQRERRAREPRAGQAVSCSASAVAAVDAAATAGSLESWVP